MTIAKGALQSKAVWGAIITLVAAFGILPFDMSFNPDTGILSLNVYTVAGAIGSAIIPGGFLLQLIGRLTAKMPIRGLW
jgi:hypothetical protein